MKKQLLIALLPLALLTSCAQETKVAASSPVNTTPKKAAMEKSEKLETITFGMGCFWCTEAFFERIDGVSDVRSGYMGGHILNPTYKQVCTGLTGHNEVSEVKYDPSVISLNELLDIFWQMHDPTTLNRQGNDVGTQYRSGIYFTNAKDKEIAVKSKAAAQPNFKDPIVTEILPATLFYEAEDYHQDYYKNNPNAPYCSMIASKIRKFDAKQSKDGTK